MDEAQLILKGLWETGKIGEHKYKALVASVRGYGKRCQEGGARSMRQRAVAKIEEQAKLVASMFDDRRHVPLCQDLATAIAALPLE